MLSIDQLIKTRRLRWAGHLSRMKECRTPHQIAFAELIKGRRPQSKPKARWMDLLKQDMKEMNIDLKTWREAAADRDKWRTCIHEKVQINQEQKLIKMEEDRQYKHAARDMYTWKCPLCPNIIKSGETGRQQIYKHISEDHKTPSELSAYPDDLKCTICNTVSKSKSGYASHQRHKHPNITPRNILRPIKDANIPLDLSATQLSDSQQGPQSTNTDELRCAACGRICKSKAGLKSHQRNVQCHAKLIDTTGASDTMDT